MNLTYDLGLVREDRRTIFHRAYGKDCEGIKFFTEILPNLGKALVQGLSSRCFTTPTTLKRQKDSALSAFCYPMLRKVFGDDGSLLESVDLDVVQRLYQLCFFAYKCELPYSPQQEQAVIDRFVETEHQLVPLDRDISRREDSLLDVASDVTASLFEDFDLNKLKPKNGPGVTSNMEVTKKFTSRLTPALPVYQNVGRYFFFNEEDAMTRVDRYPIYRTEDLFRTRNKAKVILVPKDSRGPRLISCEPAENQFIQQGIMDYLVNTLETHSLTRGQVNFTDQSVNQRLAVEGSKTREWATLDLKDASDRNSLALTRRIFGKTLQLGELLEQSRSEATILPSGTQQFLRKFAPMGSACCFPVMAYNIFILLYLSLVIEVGIQPGLARSIVFVYGDDIVVPSNLARHCIEVLERYGFSVNKEKSFISSSFLESCGVDAFEGVICSPVRLRQIWRQQDHNTQIATVAAGNLLAGRGYKRSSEYLFGFWERLHGPLPFGTEFSPYVCRRQADVWSIPRLNSTTKGLRWSKERNLQRYPNGVSLIAMGIKPIAVEDREDGYSRLMRTYVLLGKDMPLPGYGMYTLPRKYRLVTRTYNLYDQTNTVVEGL